MMNLFLHCLLMCLPDISCEYMNDRFDSSYLKARKESRGSRTWVSSKSLVVI